MACTSVVYISLEYCEADLFSGNGVCARSQVRYLAASSVRVHVICARPKGAERADASIRNVTVTAIPVNTWFSTERACSHEQFASGAAVIMDALTWHDYDACLAIDWTGVNALRLLSGSAQSRMKKAHVPLIYVNLRSYMSMTNISDEDREFYAGAEAAAVRLALSSGGGIVSLCDADDNTLRTLAPADARTSGRFRVLLPMLRAELAAIARDDRGRILDVDRKRRYITSLVRLCPDKGAHRFVRALRRLQQDDPEIWQRTGAVPLILGASTQPEYAKQVREELLRNLPGAIVMDDFLGPVKLAAVLQDAIVNVHPALYEAYGLTIVEAGAMGCPSIINFKGIGASQLIDPAVDASVAVDIHDEAALADVLGRFICDEAWRSRVAHHAYLRATSWTEAEYVKALLEFINARVAETRKYN